MNRADYLSGTSFAESEVEPLRVGRRLWIGPAGLDAPIEEGLIPVWLAGGPAFGTGAHPTTQLCLRVLERHLPPGSHVLDIGTGSGVLAIVAAKLGASSVLGLDIDPQAVVIARSNAAQNRVDDRVTMVAGTMSDLLTRGPHAFSCIVTNILAHVIVQFFEQDLAGLLEPGGWVVLSGFLRSQTPVVRAAVAWANLELLAQEQQGEWICIVARKGTVPRA